MYGVVMTIATVLFVLVCLFLILIVLLRKSDGGGLGGAFGMGGDSPFGAKTQNALDKIAIYAAIGFFALAIFLSLFPKVAGEKSAGGKSPTNTEGSSGD